MLTICIYATLQNVSYFSLCAAKSPPFIPYVYSNQLSRITVIRSTRKQMICSAIYVPFSKSLPEATSCCSC